MTPTTHGRSPAAPAGAAALQPPLQRLLHRGQVSGEGRRKWFSPCLEITICIGAELTFTFCFTCTQKSSSDFFSSALPIGFIKSDRKKSAPAPDYGGRHTVSSVFLLCFARNETLQDREIVQSPS